MALKFSSSDEPRMRSPGERLYVRLARVPAAAKTRLGMCIMGGDDFDSLPKDLRAVVDGIAAELGLGAKVE